MTMTTVDLSPRASANLQLWTPPCMPSLPMSPLLFREAAVLGVCIDCTVPTSLHAAEALFQAAIRAHPLAQFATFGVICTKVDCTPERVITRPQGEAFARSLGAAGYWETSSATGQGVVECFEALARKAVAARGRLAKRKARDEGMRLDVPPPPAGHRCAIQ
eukprot:EC839099.1.p2 GENE.EC839099.1~~EC839099.1.p2  ORF type:complete len:162 (-),score=32.96 EC839099.1:254-739(-)